MGKIIGIAPSELQNEVEYFPPSVEFSRHQRDQIFPVVLYIYLEREGGGGGGELIWVLASLHPAGIELHSCKATDAPQQLPIRAWLCPTRN